MKNIFPVSMTLLFDITQNETNFINTLEFMGQNEQIIVTQIICLTSIQGTRNNNLIYFLEKFPLASLQVLSSDTNFSSFDPHLTTDLVGYIPNGVKPTLALLDLQSILSDSLMIWTAATTLPKETATMVENNAIGWVASTHLIESIWTNLLTNLYLKKTIFNIAELLKEKKKLFRWQSTLASRENIPKEKNELSCQLTPISSVLAIVPHYKCEKWLEESLISLLSQTRIPDGIVVIDDGSQKPPIEIMQKFPNVTLLASAQNVGPYRLIQQVIEDTDYDAYMFQDADDWSTSDRLERLINSAEETGAELIGTQECQVSEEQETLILRCYPLDVNIALAEKPGHALLHPTSLVRRKLVIRLGGFATGLKFSGDTEFILRASLVARIVNIPYYCYYRRHRIDSLTTNPETGLDSPARLELLRILKQRAIVMNSAKNKGQTLNLTPLKTAPLIELQYLSGPTLH